ncbi:hypothetical protein PBI_SCTP2_362 [Salicola phage SCTP-2]|nr:hypothetical protein PBI_SCTP2_362 [Salicola phage SCTP-2]
MIKQRKHNYVHSILNHDEIYSIIDHIENMNYKTEEQALCYIHDQVKKNYLSKKKFKLLLTWHFEN